MKKSVYDLSAFSGKLLPLFLFALVLAGCKDKDKDLPKYADTDCMVLTYEQVRDWMNDGTLMKADSIKFFTGNLGPGLGMDVGAYLSLKGSIYVNSGTKLSKGENCKGESLSDSTDLVMTQVSIASLGILDGSGKLKDFDFIKLSPRDTIIGRLSYIIYQVSLTDPNGQFAKGWADPCPPLCPKPPIIVTPGEQEEEPVP